METLKRIIRFFLCGFVFISCSTGNSVNIISLHDSIIKSDFLADSLELNVIPITRNVGNVFININSDNLYIHNYKYNNKEALKLGKEKKLLGEYSSEIKDTLLKNKIFKILMELDDLKILSVESCNDNDIRVYRTSVSEKSHLFKKEKYVLVYFKNEDLISNLEKRNKRINCLYDFKNEYKRLDSNWIFYTSSTYSDYNELSDFFKRKIFAGYN
jgi:hypothetical protein